MKNYRNLLYSVICSKHAMGYVVLMEKKKYPNHVMTKCININCILEFSIFHYLFFPLKTILLIFLHFKNKETKNNIKTSYQLSTKLLMYKITITLLLKNDQIQYPMLSSSVFRGFFSDGPIIKKRKKTSRKN